MMPEITDEKGVHTVQKNAILMRRGQPPDTIVSGMQMNRDMTKILRTGPNKTCTFPNTVTTVCADAFHRARASSVRLNEGLRVLEHHCFDFSGIRRLVLSSSVESIEKNAFCGCEHLEYADLSAARGLKAIGPEAFALCYALRQVLLNDRLETIGENCFSWSGLEEVVIPGSVRSIKDCAFSRSPLTQVRFLGTTITEPHQGTESSSGRTKGCLESEQLVIGESVFARCASLKQVIFDPSSAVTEIRSNAF